MDDTSPDVESMNFLEAIIYNLNEGMFVIHDQKAFDKGISQILDGIQRVKLDA